MLFQPLIVTAEDVIRLVERKGKGRPGVRAGANSDKYTANRQSYLKKGVKAKVR